MCIDDVRTGTGNQGCSDYNFNTNAHHYDTFSTTKVTHKLAVLTFINHDKGAVSYYCTMHQGAHFNRKLSSIIIVALPYCAYTHGSSRNTLD